jgi:hypothetical protein
MYISYRVITVPLQRTGTYLVKRKKIRILEFWLCLNGIRSYTVYDYIETGSMSMTHLLTSPKVTTESHVMLAT